MWGQIVLSLFQIARPISHILAKSDGSSLKVGYLYNHEVPHQDYLPAQNLAFEDRFDLTTGIVRKGGQCDCRLAAMGGHYGIRTSRC